MALALGNDDDIALNSAGLPYFIGGADEARQRIRVRFRFVRGEWYRDTRLGVPWFEVILVKQPNLTLVRSLFRQVVRSVRGVTLQRMGETYDAASRTLSPSFAARFEDGSTITDVDTFRPLEGA